jgi:hypothetical protein
MSELVWLLFKFWDDAFGLRHQEVKVSAFVGLQNTF